MNFKFIALSVEKYIHKVSVGLSWISVAVLILMMLFMTADVIGRYLLGRPIIGSIDFVVVMMVILIFPCFANVTFLKRHVRTDIIYNAFSKRRQGVLDIINSLCSIFIVALITWQLGARVWSIIQYPPGITTDYFQWPHMPFIALAMVGFGLMSLELIIWFIRSVNQAVYG